MPATILIVSITFLFNACKKKSSDEDSKDKKPRVTFYNSALSSKNLDLYFGAKKVSTTGFVFGKQIDYKDYEAVQYKIEVTDENSNQLISGDYLTLKAGLSYSVFVSGIYPSLKFVKQEDNFNPVDPEKAKIRLVHLSPDAMNIDLHLNGVLFGQINAVSYKDASSFIPLESSDAYHFEIVESGTGKVLADLGQVSIKKGKIYTICATGLKNGGAANEKLKLSLIPNN
jgi:hypothetical protein